MKGAQRNMIGIAERTLVNALDWVHSVHHIEDRDGIRLARQRESTAGTSLRSDKVRDDEIAEYFREIASRHLSALGDLLA